MINLLVGFTLILSSLGQTNYGRNLEMTSPTSEGRTTGFQQTGELSSDAAIQRDANATVGDNSGSFLSRESTTNQQSQQQSVRNSSQTNRSSQLKSQTQVVSPVKCHLTIGFKVEPRSYENLKKRLTVLDKDAIIAVDKNEVTILNSKDGDRLRRVALLEPGIKKVIIQ